MVFDNLHPTIKKNDFRLGAQAASLLPFERSKNGNVRGEQATCE